MERTIAIDSVCAWPNLTLMPDGAIAAVIFNQPTHGKWEGDVECWASEDDGRTWQRRGTAARHEPGTNRMNVAAGLAQDRALVVVASGWSKRPPPGRPVESKGAEILEPWVCRSGDGGRTWSVAKGVAAHPEQAHWLVPFGSIVALPDGALGATFYGSVRRADRAGSAAFLYASEDDGRTWAPRSVISPDNATEAALLVLDGGRMLAAVRTEGDEHLELFVSGDGGATWRRRGPLSRARQIPAHLLRLADGRILLAYGLRNAGCHGVAARLSADGGESWTPPRVLWSERDTMDCGYPASVQTKDGTIVTAYYASATPAHQRYHMGVIRWRADGPA